MAEIDTLEVKIKANAQSATQSLNSLARALGTVQSALTSTNKDGSNSVQRISKSINDLNNSLTGLTSGGIAKLNALAYSLNNYADALDRFKGLKKIPSLSKALKEVNEALEIPEKSDLAEQSGGSASVEQVSDAMRGVAEETIKAKDNLAKLNGEFDKLWNSLKRIAFYRLIRTALKDIGDAFETGLENAYKFSQQTPGFTRLADALDHIKSITSQMVNQLGAFWGEVQQLILPAVEYIVEKLRALFEWLTQFFAALNGEHTYMYAKLVELKWNDATDALKKYKAQLLGLDEINNISSNELSTTTKKEEIPYEWKSVNEDIYKWATGLKKIVVTIGDLLFDWSPLEGMTQDQMESLLIPGLLGLAGGLISGAPGALIGTLAGVAIKLLLDQFMPAENEKVYTLNTLEELLLPAIGGLTGGIFGGEAGAIIGTLAGIGIQLILDAFLPTKAGTEITDEADMRDLLLPGLIGMAGSILVFDTTGDIKGAVIGFSVGATIGLILNHMNDFEDQTGENKDSVLKKVRGILNKIVSVTSTGIIGWKIGKLAFGVTGGLLGLTAGVALGLILNELGLTDSTGDNKDTIAAKLVKVLKAISLGGTTGAIMGWVVGGTAGALIGFNIGVSITLLIQDLEWDWGKEVDNISGMPKDLLPSGSAGKIKPGGAYGAKSTYLEQAQGGVVPNGSLFWAGEAGPEFIGSIGTTSAVANTGQMTEAIYKAAYMGMSQALKENGGNGMNGFIPATTDDLFIAMKKKASNYTKRTGESAFG